MHTILYLYKEIDILLLDYTSNSKNSMDSLLSVYPSQVVVGRPCDRKIRRMYRYIRYICFGRKWIERDRNERKNDYHGSEKEGVELWSIRKYCCRPMVARIIR